MGLFNMCRIIYLDSANVYQLILKHGMKCAHGESSIQPNAQNHIYTNKKHQTTSLVML